MSEIAPRQVRGAILSGYQFCITIGILIASCVVYGTQDRLDSGSYRIPIAIQIAWALILGKHPRRLYGCPSHLLCSSPPLASLRILTAFSNWSIPPSRIAPLFRKAWRTRESDPCHGQPPWSARKFRIRPGRGCRDCRRSGICIRDHAPRQLRFQLDTLLQWKSLHGFVEPAPHDFGDIDADDAAVDWHQLHLLFRHDLFQEPRHYLGSFPHFVGHHARQRPVDSYLILDHREVRSSNSTDLRSAWDAGVRVHCRYHWHC